MRFSAFRNPFQRTDSFQNNDPTTHTETVVYSFSELFLTKTKMSTALATRKRVRDTQEVLPQANKRLKNTKPRIGIICTLPKNEAKKEELCSIRKRTPKRPWLKLADRQKHTITRKPYNGRKTTKGVPTDISVGKCIELFHGKDFEVDLILPADISDARLKANDLNFMLIYDLLEGFHTDRTKGKRVYKNLVQCLNKATNIFPQMDYQKFINSKAEYYNYFAKHGVPICPTFTLGADAFKASVDSSNLETVTKNLIAKVKKLGWGDHFICKPVYGQESKDFKKFSLKDGEASFTKYIEKLMKKYPGVIFQKYLHKFGNSKICPEVRLYFVGDEYQFSIVATKQKILTLKEEGGSMKLPYGQTGSLDKLIEQAKDVIAKLPLMKVKQGRRNKILPRLLTRVDMGVLQDGKFKPFVNEVEFVPSLYVEDHSNPIDLALAEQMVTITKEYLGLDDSDSDF